MSRPFVAKGDRWRSGGVRGREGSEELVEVSQPPEEQREETSPSREWPSRAGSREEEREDLPEEPLRVEARPPVEIPRLAARLGLRTPTA
mmetsp:Transcript_50644/g.144732  ORF Transcript_50644/g.144732 Transcript_50644/m.144732 type:complete len:90 (+) Transcript_50644:684-953(+)